MNHPRSHPKYAALKGLLVSGLVGVSVALAACGQKGPLVMPSQTPSVSPSASASASSPPPESK